MIGNISKSKGFKGDKGSPGDFIQPHFGIDEEGNLYYEVEYVPSLKTAPFIGLNGHWYAFETTTQKFYDTGVDARGEIPTVVIEKYINTQTADIKSQIESLKDRINTHAHFKGYFANDADIEAIEPPNVTPNDFAYSAESGTVWIYEDMGDGQYAWADSGEVIPNQAIQASDDHPVMNGGADAGQSNEYSRSDHCHPSDESKLSVQEFNEFKNSLGDIGGTGSSVFVVQFDTSNNTADKTYDEILAATRQYKTVMLYEGNRFLASLNAVTDHGLFFENHDIQNVNYITEYQCIPTNDWIVTASLMAKAEFVEQVLADQIGKIETALDNIIAKYGLEGDVV